MKVYLLIDGRKTRCAVPFKGADHVLPHGIAACPKCKATGTVPDSGNLFATLEKEFTNVHQS